MARRAFPLPSLDESPEARAVAYAQRTLYGEGPEAVSMNAAIEASGVSRRTLYKRLGSREQLVRRAVETSIAACEGQLELLDDQRLTLAGHLTLLATWLTDRREAFDFLLLSPKARALPFHDELIAPFRRRLESRVVALVRKAQKAGEVSREAEPGLVAFVLLALLRAILGSPSFGPQAARRTRDLEQVIRLALAGLRPVRPFESARTIG